MMEALDQPALGSPCVVGAVLSEAEAAMTAAGIEQPRLEAAWLVEHVTGLSPLRLRIEPTRKLTAPVVQAVRGLVARRVNREPLQYLLGSQEFLGRDFCVTPAVLIPRPESVLLVEEAVARLRGMPSPVVVDVGTGSGCLAVSLAKALPNATVVAIDVSREALGVAQGNISRHGVQDRVECREGDLLAPLVQGRIPFAADIILSNPPYIAETDWEELQPEVRNFEPRLALLAGPDGMDVHRRLLDEAPRFLRPKGFLLMEVGFGQSAAVCGLAEELGRFRVYDVRKDEADIERVVCLQAIDRE